MPHSMETRKKDFRGYIKSDEKKCKILSLERRM